MLNITPKYWGESVFKKIEARGIERFSTEVGGKEASRHKSEDMGIPMDSYFVLVNDEYWINITGKTGYETELQQVLESFEFIE